MNFFDGLSSIWTIFRESLVHQWQNHTLFFIIGLLLAAYVAFKLPRTATSVYRRGQQQWTQDSDFGFRSRPAIASIFLFVFWVVFYIVIIGALG